MSPAEDHMGYLIVWTKRAVKQSWFPQWAVNEILSEAFMRADHLLSEKYDSKRGNVTTFLSACLRTDLSYRYQRSLGKSIHWEKKECGTGRRRVWTQRVPSVEHIESLAPAFEIPEDLDLEAAELTPREAHIVELLLQGKTRVEIAQDLGVSPSRVSQLILHRIKEKIEPYLDGQP